MTDDRDQGRLRKKSENPYRGRDPEMAAQWDRLMTEEPLPPRHKMPAWFPWLFWAIIVGVALGWFL